MIIFDNLERINGMKRIVPLLLCALTALAVGCSTRSEIEKSAYSRLPKALEEAMMEDLSATGGADIVSPVIIYSCDSLFIVQFKAVAKDPGLKGYSFPVRYVFVQDMVLSHVYGHPVYAEKITGCPEMTPEEIEQTRAEFKRDAKKAYVYYASTASPITQEDL